MHAAAKHGSAKGMFCSQETVYILPLFFMHLVLCRKQACGSLSGVWQAICTYALIEHEHRENPTIFATLQLANEQFSALVTLQLLESPPLMMRFDAFECAALLWVYQQSSESNPLTNFLARTYSPPAQLSSVFKVVLVQSALYCT